MRILASPAFANEKVNPYNALLYRGIEAIYNNKNVEHNKLSDNKSTEKTISEYSHKKALLHKYDIIHFHWPDGYINQSSIIKSIQRAILLAVIILVSQLKGTKIVWTVHNVVAHDVYHVKFSKTFMQWFVNHCHGLIFMSEESKATFLQHYQLPLTTQFSIIPHGHYRNSYPPAIDKAVAKSQLGLSSDRKILLFFGMIKPYKNIDELIRVFNQTNFANYDLVIAGKPDSIQLTEYLQRQKATNKNIHLWLEFIANDQLHVYLSAADIVILPYKSILNSGALLLALSFNRPVIAPHIGAFISLQQELGSRWIYSYEGDLQVETLRKALSQFKTLQSPAICPLENYDWNKLSALTINFYQDLFRASSTNQKIMS